MNREHAIVSLITQTNGAIIKEAEVGGKIKFAVMAYLDDDFKTSNSIYKNHKAVLETGALKVFPTKKGARGYCVRHHITVKDSIPVT
jgi:hypothetical protein